MPGHPLFRPRVRRARRSSAPLRPLTFESLWRAAITRKGRDRRGLHTARRDRPLAQRALEVLGPPPRPARSCGGFQPGVEGKTNTYDPGHGLNSVVLR